jgi:peptidyl-prolyl cis-trans isomerase C
MTPNSPRRMLLLIGLAAALGACQQKGDKRTPVVDRPGPAAPTQSQEELSTPLAQIEDVIITIGDFQQQLGRQTPYVRARYTSLEQKKEFLENMVRFEVLAKEAQKRGFDKDPEVVRTLKQVMVQKLMKDEFETKVTPDSISDAEMKTYYDANLAEFVKAEEVRASAIILKNKAQADKIATEAQGEAGRTNKGFRELVGKYSTDEESKLRGGDLRYFTIDSKDLPAPLVKAAFALAQTGDVSTTVDGGNGLFYVIKQTGRKRAITRTFDDAKPQIRNKLYRDKRVGAQDGFVAGLRAAAKVQINEANLAKVRIDTTTPEPDDGHGHDMPGNR